MVQVFTYSFMRARYLSEGNLIKPGPRAFDDRETTRGNDVPIGRRDDVPAFRTTCGSNQPPLACLETKDTR